MKQNLAILWKSWRELRWFLIGGWLLILIPSFTEAWVKYRRYGEFYTDIPEGFVLGMGGIIGILLAVALTCRDFTFPVHTFWASRPIKNFRFFSIKYLSGLASLWLIIFTPLLLQLCFKARNRVHGQQWWSLLNDDTANVLWSHPWTLMLIYSCAFLLGAAIRRAVPAALLSIAAGLLVYFAPLVIPRLGFLDSFRWLEQEQPLGLIPRNYGGFYGIKMRFDFQSFSLFVNPAFILFIACMLMFSIAVFSGAFWLVRKNKTFSLDHRAMCWCLGGISLLLFFGASRELGTSLTLEDKFSSNFFLDAVQLSGKEAVASEDVNDFTLLRFDPVHVESQSSVQRNPNGEPIHGPDPVNSQTASDNNQKLIFGINHGFSPYTYTNHSYCKRWYWDADQQLIYTLVDANEDKSHKSPDPGGMMHGIELTKKTRRTKLELLVLKSNGEKTSEAVGRIDLTQIFPSDPDGFELYSFRENLPKLFFHHNKIYLHAINDHGSQLAVIDVSNPALPLLLRTSHAELSVFSFSADRPTAELPLPYWLNDLSPRERLEALAVMYGERQLSLIFAVQGSFIFCNRGRELQAYKITGEKEISQQLLSGDRPTTTVTALTLELAGQYQPPLIQRVFGLYTLKLLPAGNILYALEKSFSRRIAAYDISDPRNVRRIGYYTAPDDPQLSDMALLPDGRLLAAGRKIHILEAIKN